MADPSPFYARVWALVDTIPWGRVTTYGHVARALGAAGSARMVGWALNAAAATGLPCHRVVNRSGTLTGRLHFAGPHVMEERLRGEGITVDDDGRVRLDRHLWVPGEDAR